MLEEVVEQLNIKKPIVMGHSFGGRLAIRYASENNIEKLILFGSPVRPEKSPTDIKTRILIFLAYSKRSLFTTFTNT